MGVDLFLTSCSASMRFVKRINMEVEMNNLYLAREIPSKSLSLSLLIFSHEETYVYKLAHCVSVPMKRLDL